MRGEGTSLLDGESRPRLSGREAGANAVRLAIERKEVASLPLMQGALHQSKHGAGQAAGGARLWVCAACGNAAEGVKSPPVCARKPHHLFVDS